MSIYLLMLIIPPIIVSILSWVIFHHRITWLEFLLQATLPVILATMCYGIAVSTKLTSVEVLSGKVLDKYSKKVSCSHSYECRCYIDSKGNRHCSTCYDHDYDVDWRVRTTLGTYHIKRVDRQGLKTPERWDIVAIGEPVANTHSYVNYVKAAPDSIFNMRQVKAFEDQIPDKPDIYDYYRLDRLVTTAGVNPNNRDEWNLTLANHLRDIGPKYEVNVNLVFTDKPKAFGEALEAAWYGGEKNEVTVVVGTKYPHIDWVKVFSWSKSEMVNIQIRNELIDSKILHPYVTSSIIFDTIKQHYQRRSMEDFKYLETEIEPSTTLLVVVSLLSIILSLGIGYLSATNDINPQYRKWFTK